MQPMVKSVPDDVRFRVLRVLQDEPDLSQREIAVRLGVSLGAVNYCLRALTEKGQVKVRNFRSSDNKLRYAYILTPEGIGERVRMTGRFVQRKIREYAALRPRSTVCAANWVMQVAMKGCEHPLPFGVASLRYRPFRIGAMRRAQPWMRLE